MITASYKPMQYIWDPPNRHFEVLAQDVYEGFPFAIMNYGTHPCCYVGVPKGHTLYKRIYDEGDMPNCHGGVTYSERGLSRQGEVYIPFDYWVLGWDYGHAGDYCSYYSEYDQTSFLHDCKKWTTKEMLEDVETVILQLKDPIVLSYK